MVGSERKKSVFSHYDFERQEEMMESFQKKISMKEILDNLALDLEFPDGEEYGRVEGAGQESGHTGGKKKHNGALSCHSEKSQITEIQNNLIIVENYYGEGEELKDECLFVRDRTVSGSMGEIEMNHLRRGKGDREGIDEDHEKDKERGVGDRDKRSRERELIRDNCHRLRYDFLLKIEDHFKGLIERKKEKNRKSPKTTTKTVTTVSKDSTGLTAATRTTTTITETVITEIVQSSSALCVPGYIDDIEIDFSSLPPTKVFIRPSVCVSLSVYVSFCVYVNVHLHPLCLSICFSEFTTPQYNTIQYNTLH